MHRCRGAALQVQMTDEQRCRGAEGRGVELQVHSRFRSGSNLEVQMFIGA